MLEHGLEPSVRAAGEEPLDQSRPELERRVAERRSYEERRRHNYTPPGGRNRRGGDDRRSWVDRREEVRRLFE
ncbi:hypothetical protein HS125_15860 [bacterium]|nr:hypothetical protein [bacterium]